MFFRKTDQILFPLYFGSQMLHLHLFVSNALEMKIKESMILSGGFFSESAFSRKGNIFRGEIGTVQKCSVVNSFVKSID